MTDQNSIALVTGANRGIGREVARQLAANGFTVILTARSPEKAEKATSELKTKDSDIHPFQLDSADEQSIRKAADFVEKEFGRLDVLVNNAAINYDTWQTTTEADLDVVRETLDTNLLGPWRVSQEFIPLMKKNRYGRIVNVSSESGSLSSMGGGTPAYGVSKAALNALTVKLAGELKKFGILVNSVCPGWVRTDMGGRAAPRSVEKGAKGIVWAATLPDDGPTGQFFRDGKPLRW